MKELERFYCKLYASGHSVPEIDKKKTSSFLGDLIKCIKTLRGTEIKSEGKISSKECFDFLDSFHNNITPGNDGIPIKFYKKMASN